MRRWLTILFCLIAAPAWGAVELSCVYPSGSDLPSNLYGGRYSGASCYTTLALWEAGEQANLMAVGRIAYCEVITGTTICWGQPDTTDFNFNGWTTGTTSYAVIDVASGTTMSLISGGVTDYGARHEGVWNESKYRLDTTAIQDLFTVTSSGLRAYGVQARSVKVGSGYARTVYVASASNQVYLDGFISIADTQVQANGQYARCYHLEGSYAAARTGAITNSVAVALSYTRYGIYIYRWNATVANNTTWGGEYGIGGDYIDQGTVRAGVTNNAAMSASVSGFWLTNGGWPSGADYNVSWDASAPGGNVATGKTDYASYFTDTATYDFHLKDTSASLWGLDGTDLAATVPYDIDLTARTRWDIGADEYVSGTPPVTETPTLRPQAFPITLGSLAVWPLAVWPLAAAVRNRRMSRRDWFKVGKWLREDQRGH